MLETEYFNYFFVLFALCNMSLNLILSNHWLLVFEIHTITFLLHQESV